MAINTIFTVITLIIRNIFLFTKATMISSREIHHYKEWGRIKFCRSFGKFPKLLSWQQKIWRLPEIDVQHQVHVAKQKVSKPTSLEGFEVGVVFVTVTVKNH